MTVSRINQEYRTILDFSKDKISKNFIQQALRQIEVLDFNIKKEESPTQTVTVINNDIKIGMFVVRLVLRDGFIRKSKFTAQKLRSYGKFHIKIYEQSVRSTNELNLTEHTLFKDQQWVDKSQNNELGIKDLVDAISYCSRLNRLRMFS